MMNNAAADEELVLQIAQSQRPLFALILALVRRPADAEDVLQETNVLLWRKRESFQRGSHFHAWACQIARLQVLAWRTRQGRRGELFDEHLLAEIAAAALEESAEDNLRAQALAGCLKKLAESQRALILLRYEPRSSVNALAEKMGKSARAVSESLRRIRETLRQCMERTLAAESIP